MTVARTAVVAGASGLVGGHVVRALLDRPEYSHVTVLVRRQLDLVHPRLEQRLVDFDRLDEQADAFAGADVFCCLGTTIKKAGSQAAFRKVDYAYPLTLGRLARQQGARRFLLVSSMGANPHSRVFYSRVKGELENGLAELGLTALLIFRPSLLLGERQEHRPGERIGAAVMKVVGPLMVGGLRKYRAIHGRIVAQAMVYAAGQPWTGRHLFESDRIAELGA
ncbi:MAG: oxidoreductase [Firmicutes bacterium]|nr:oxidoreductase [Bacillota bacterium]